MTLTPRDKVSVSQLYSTKTPAPMSQVVLYPVLDVNGLLLDNPKRQYFLNSIAQYTGIERSLYQALYETTITRFVELVQAIPHHSGGKPASLMDYSLERATTILRHYRQSAGAEFSPLYAYALFTAALFQEVGRVISQQAVVISDEEGKYISEWSPFEGSLVALKAAYYKLRPIGNQWISLGQSVTALLARQCMPAPGFEWIASDYKILALWMGILTGDKEKEGELLHWLSLAYKPFNLGGDGGGRSGERLTELEIKTTRPAETVLGEEFLAWLSEGLAAGIISVNSSDASVHILTNGMMLEPAIFEKFCQIYGRSNGAVINRQVAMLAGPLSGSDVVWQQFFAKTLEGGQAQGSKGLFFNPQFISAAAPANARSGLVINNAETIYKNASIPAASSLTPATPPPNKGLVNVQNKVDNSVRSGITNANN